MSYGDQPEPVRATRSRDQYKATGSSITDRCLPRIAQKSRPGASPRVPFSAAFALYTHRYALLVGGNLKKNLHLLLLENSLLEQACYCKRHFIRLRRNLILHEAGASPKGGVKAGAKRESKPSDVTLLTCIFGCWCRNTSPPVPRAESCISSL